MKSAGVPLLAAVAVGALVFAGCSSDSKQSDTTTTTKTKAKESATATPTKKLANGALVTVTASGFRPGLTLGINQCASTNGSDVSQDDCDLGGIKTIMVGADGAASGTINVTVGPIGSTGHMCTASGTRCFLSVGELSNAVGAERAPDINLTFTS